MYYGVDKSTGYFCHRAKNGTMNSTTSAKGTDGKPNNSSTYNHEYYMRNKEKWGVKYSEQTDGDKDFDDANFTDENRLGDTDFYGIRNADGSWTVIEENMKWKLPAGVSREEIMKAVGAVSQQDKASRMSAKDFEKAVSSALENMPGKSGKEFDVDAAARDVIRGKYKNGAERKAALGDDYAVVQKRVNEMMKAKHSDDDGEVLEHHGILGQKWGVRRFQKLDGTRTAAGKAREKGESSSNVQNGGTRKQGIDKEKLKKAAAITAGVAVTAALVAHPASRQVLAKYGKTALNNLPNAMGKVGSVVGKGTAATVNKVEAAANRASDAMIDAMLVSVGGIAISKLGETLATDENASERERNTKKIALDTATAGIQAATKAGGNSSSNNGGKGGSVGKEVTDKLGTPSKKGIDKQSADWQNLFKDSNGNQLDAETRGTIKALASQGYDMDQIKQYKKEFGHGDIQDWIDSIISDPTRW